MIPADLSLLANHLWQSSLFAVAAWLLTLALKKNRAAIRYSIWLAASVKFLIPFSWLVQVGDQFAWRESPAVRQTQFYFMVHDVSRPFGASVPAMPFATSAGPASIAFVEILLLGVWLCGFATCLIVWLRQWRRVRAALRTATPLPLNLPIEAMSSHTRLEPGVFGIRRPVLLLPQGITDRMNPTQLDLIVAHELCHVRRRDNLTAALHMLVESVFWFNPLLWWIRERLVEERERACDEEVLKMAGDPNDYAEGILNVCKFYLSSPLVCASGVSGSDLKKRIEAIVENRAASGLNLSRKMLLTAAGLAAVCGPVTIGVLGAVPSPGQVQHEAMAVSPKEFEVASIKIHKGPDEGFHITGDRGLWRAINVPPKFLVEIAYDLRPGQLIGAPKWIETEHYDIEGKFAGGRGPAPKVDGIGPYLQSLLADRFQLKFHNETRDMPVYVLSVSKTGVKLMPSDPSAAGPQIRMRMGQLNFTKVRMEAFARELSRQLGRPVLDETDLPGLYDFDLSFSPELPVGGGPERPLEPRAPGNDAPAIFTAVQEQLGLKLDSKKAPIQLLVIDRIEKAEEN
jgi:bla regulator protein BlaR1